MTPGACTSRHSFTHAPPTLPSSSSLRRREIRMRSLLGTFLMPLLHTALFSFTSRRTSLVPMILEANFLISFTARGALLLNLMLCSFLCRLMV